MAHCSLIASIVCQLEQRLSASKEKEVVQILLFEL